MTSDHVHKACLYTFNKFFAETVLFLKKRYPATLKRELDRHYQVMENLHITRDNIDHFRTHVLKGSDSADEDVFEALLNLDVTSDGEDRDAESSYAGCLRKSPHLLRANPVKGVSFEDILHAAQQTGDRQSFRDFLQFVYLLTVFHAVHANAEKAVSVIFSEDESDHAVAVAAESQQERPLHREQAQLEQALDAVAECRKGDFSRLNEKDALDENQKRALVKLAECCSSSNGSSAATSKTGRSFELAPAAVDPSGASAPPSSHDGGGANESEQQQQQNSFVEMFENSKIGSLAKEMVDDMDLSQFMKRATESSADEHGNPKNPMDMFNMQSILDPNSGVGSMLAKMGQKMQTKVNSGELRFDELMGEAMGMISGGGGGLLQSNPMLKDLMQTLLQQQQQKTPPSNNDGSGERNASGGFDAGGLQDLLAQFSGAAGAAASGGQGHSSGSGGASNEEQHLEQLFSRLGGLSGPQRRAAEAAASSMQHQQRSGRGAGNAKDRLRKRFEDKQQHLQQQHQQQRGGHKKQ